MTFLQFLNENLVWIFIILFLFCGSMAACVKWVIQALIKHRERMAELRIKELELTIQARRAQGAQLKEEPWSVQQHLLD